MQDRTIKYGLEADARRFVAGVKEAERALEGAKARANQLNETQLALQARGVQLSKALQSKITNDEWVEVVKRGGQNRKLLAENVAAQQKAAKDIATAQKNLTREIERESKKQATAQQAGIRGAISGTARGALQGSGLPSVPTGAGTALIAAAAAASAVVLLKNAISSYIDLANAVQRFGVVADASAEQASKLIGAARMLNIDVPTLDAAFNSLKSAVANNPEQFQALGIALKNTDGSARPLIDVFADLRERIAGATKDAGTQQLAQELLGGSYRDLLPLLGLTNAELAALEARVAEFGGVMDAEGIQRAQEYQLALKELELTGQGVGNSFAQSIVPVIVNALDGLGQAFDTVGIFATKVMENMIREGARAANALAALFRGDFEAAGNYGEAFLNNGPDLGAIGRESIDQAQANHDRQVASRAAAAKAIVNASQTGSGPGLGFATRGALADANRGANDAARAAADAIREQMDARRDAAAEWIEALRENLDAYQKEHDAAIRFIQDEQRAHAEAHQARVEQIQDEQKALEEAFRIRDQARSDEVAAIRDQISATDALYDAEKARQDLAEAEADLAHESTVQIFRERNETEEQYQRRVFNQQERIKDATKKVEDEKTAIARAAIRAELDARIKALEVEADLERRALDDKKRAAEIIMESIRDEMAAEREKADERIQQLRDEQQAERDRVSDHIKEIEHETKSILKELEDRLKAIQTHSAGVVAAYGAQTIAANVAEQAARNATNAQAGLAGPTATQDPGGGAFNGSTSGTVVPVSPSGGGAVGIGGGIPGGGGFDMPVNDYPHTMTFARPTLMVDMASGAAIGAAAVSGPEPVTFHGVRTQSGPGGGVASTVNVYGLGLDEAARVIASRVDRNLERRARGRTAAGFGRR